MNLVAIVFSDHVFMLIMLEIWLQDIVGLSIGLRKDRQVVISRASWERLGNSRTREEIYR